MRVPHSLRCMQSVRSLTSLFSGPCGPREALRGRIDTVSAQPWLKPTKTMITNAVRIQ